jgi:hypothetical protein
MNERIQQLAEQALQLVADEHANGDESRLNLASYTVKDLIQEKFAELIVKECAELCEGEAIFAGSNGRKDASASNCSTIIRKHFGVEE